MSIKQLLCLILAISCGSASIAQERRPGDIYFANPDIAIAEGGSAEVELMAYVGNTDFGAIALRVTYTANELDAANAVFGDAPLLQDFLVSQPKDGQFGIVGVAESSDLLIGEISLAKLTLTPELTAGASIDVQIQIINMLDRSGASFAQTDAGSLHITVTSGDANQPQVDGGGEPPLVEATGAEMDLIRHLWRPAGIVQIMRSYWDDRRLFAYPVRIDASRLAIY